jgi:hypothetical protein
VAAGDLAGAESWIYSHLEQVRKGIETLALDAENGEETEPPEQADAS